MFQTKHLCSGAFGTNLHYIWSNLASLLKTILTEILEVLFGMNLVSDISTKVPEKAPHVMDQAERLDF